MTKHLTGVPPVSFTCDAHDTRVKLLKENRRPDPNLDFRVCWSYSKVHLTLTAFMHAMRFICGILSGMYCGQSAAGSGTRVR